MNLKSIGVVGSGQMGNGIAQVVAAQGLNVKMMDVSKSALDKAIETISSSCDRLIKKDKLSEDQKEENAFIDFYNDIYGGFERL